MISYLYSVYFYISSSLVFLFYYVLELAVVYILCIRPILLALRLLGSVFLLEP